MDKKEKALLLGIARASLETAFSHEKAEIPDTEKRLGAFVTLKKAGSLRGCIGYLTGYKPLYQEIHELARAAAFEDYRFPPLEESELPAVTIEISVLTEPQRIESPAEFHPGTDGIILVLGNRRAVFLPQVAEETGWSREEMLNALALKGGMPRQAWKSPEAELYTFQTEVFSEEDL